MLLRALFISWLLLPGATWGRPLLEKCVQRLVSNDFQRERGFTAYSVLLKAHGVPTLANFLANLGSQDLYLDAGAGNAVAVRESLRSDSNLRTVAVGFRKPESRGLEMDLVLFSDRFDYFDGGTIEELIQNPESELFALRGKVTRLTDVFGPIDYTNNIESVFNAYADLLAVGGQALVHVWEGSTQFLVQNKDGNTSRVTLRELSGLIPVVTGGRLRVREARMRLEGEWPQFSATVLWLEKVAAESHGAISVFETIAMKDEAPPERKILVQIPDGFSFDPVLAREADLERENTKLQRAVVPDAFKHH